MQYCTLSLYLPRKTYLQLLDVVTERLGFKSRSECVTRLLERLFVAEGLTDEKGRPTDKALSLSEEIVKSVQLEKARRSATKRQFAASFSSATTRVRPHHRR